MPTGPLRKQHPQPPTHPDLGLRATDPPHLVNNPSLPTCRKAVLERELADVEAVLRKANPTTTKDQP
jgi:hypothetical protein